MFPVRAWIVQQSGIDLAAFEKRSLIGDKPGQRGLVCLARTEKSHGRELVQPGANEPRLLTRYHPRKYVIFHQKCKDRTNMMRLPSPETERQRDVGLTEVGLTHGVDREGGAGRCRRPSPSFTCRRAT